MGTIWSKEPALIVGAVVTVIVNVVASLQGEGFISDVAAGQVTDLVAGVQGLIVALLPLITAYIARGQVYSPASYDAK